MKKLFPLILAVMLVVAMAVPVMAEEYNGTDFPSIDSLSVNMEQYPFYTIEKVSDKYELRFYSVAPYASPQVNSFHLLANECWHLRFDFYDGMWHFVVDNSLSEDQLITIVTDTTSFMSNFDVLTKDGNHVVFAPTPPLTECDGSTCPVADLNTDGVCDTCGNALAFSVVRSYRPAGYPDDLPNMPTGFDGSSHYLVYVTPSAHTQMYVFTPRDGSPVANWDTKGAEDGSIRVASQDSSNNPVDMAVREYRLNNDGEWYSISNKVTDNATFGSVENTTVKFSTLALYDKDGILFFPETLWARILMVTQGQMMETMVELLGTMRILVLCGVGCLTLLIGLALFGKRSLIYRG